VAVVYFSGHGFQFKGENMLVPVDFNAKYEYEVQEQSLALNTVIGALGDAKAEPKLVFLDCCRSQEEFRSITKSLNRGLAEVKTPDDETLVSFATKHGATAEDNPEQSNSNYTKALASEILTPNRKVEDTMKAVARTVRESSRGAQIPYTYGNLIGDFYFAGRAGNNGGDAAAGGDVNAKLLQEMERLRQRMDALQTTPPPPPQRPSNDSVSSRPPPPSEPTVPASFTEFLKDMFQHNAANDPAIFSGDFASESEYCYKDGGSASRGFITNDRRKLVQRYPARTYTNITVDSIRPVTQSEVRASYSYNYSYGGAGKSASGHSRVTITAERIDGRWQITRFNESVDRK